MISIVKPLCLSFRTPPAIRPQAILIGKMIPEWIKQGIRPVIITYDDNGDWDINLSIYKISQFKINKYLNKIPPIRWLLRKKYYQEIFNIAKLVIEKHNLNLVFSFSNPQESNILGAMLKKRLGIKFISHFSDPWYDNPFESFSGWRAKRVLKQEKEIIKNSDKVIFVNNQARKLIMKRYPAKWKQKAEVIPHCYDLKDYPEVEKEKGDKFVFSYIGVFYKQRNPEILFKTLRNLLDKKKEILGEFKLKLVGCAGDYSGYSAQNIKQMIDKYGLKEMVEIVPTVSYKESLKEMKLSDCLIVIDADIANSPFLPSKVVDYAGSGNLILGITPEESPTRDFLDNLGYEVFNYEQVDELSVYLEKLIQEEIKINLNQDFLKQYDVYNTTAKLINIFRKVLNS